MLAIKFFQRWMPALVLASVLTPLTALTASEQAKLTSRFDEKTHRTIKILAEKEDKADVLEAYETYEAYTARAANLQAMIHENSKEINLLKKDKQYLSRYNSLYYWLMGKDLSGTRDKYVSSNYPSDSLYNTITAAELENYARLTGIVYSSATFDKYTSLKSNKDHFEFLQKSYRMPTSIKEDIGGLLYEFYLFSKETNLREEDSKKIQAVLETLSKLQQIELVINYLLNETSQKAVTQKDPHIESLVEKVSGLVGEKSLQNCRCKTYNDFLSFLHKYFSEQEISVRKELYSIELKYNTFAVNFKNHPIFKENFFRDYEVVSTFFRNTIEFSGFALYSKAKHELILVFAGSKSDYDWLMNLQFWSSPANANLRLGNKDLAIAKGHTEILRDMMLNYDRIMDEILSEIANEHNHPERDIKVTVLGHSLGGAISSLVAYYFKSHLLPHYGYKSDLARERISQAEVRNITFGAPRFVNQTGAKVIENSLGKGNILRFWNTHDLVPSIVPSLLGRKHIGIDIPLPDSYFYEFMSPFTSHHSMDRYWALAPYYFSLIKKENRTKIVLQERLEVLEDVRKQNQDELTQVQERLKASAALFQELHTRFPELILPQTSSSWRFSW